MSNMFKLAEDNDDQLCSSWGFTQHHHTTYEKHGK